MHLHPLLLSLKKNIKAYREAPAAATRDRLGSDLERLNDELIDSLEPKQLVLLIGILHDAHTQSP